MWVSAWRTPLMNVTAETSGQSPCRATSSSAPRPFWIVITVAPAMRPGEPLGRRLDLGRLRREDDEVGLGQPGRVVGRGDARDRSLLPLMRRPSRTSASACSGRRVSTDTSATCARCPA